MARLRSILGMAVAFVLLPTVVPAEPTIWGTTGLIEVPTARFLRPSAISAGVGWYNEADTTTMFVDAGLAPDLEVSAVRVDVKGGPDKTVVGAKMLLFRGLPPIPSVSTTSAPTTPIPTPERALEKAVESKMKQIIEPLLKPAVAVGVRNVNDERLPGMDGAQFYIVASARIPLIKLDAHYGFLKDRRKLGVIMGADLKLGRYTLLAEYERDHVNAGLRMGLGRGLSAMAALRDVDGRKDLLLSANWRLSF